MENKIKNINKIISFIIILAILMISNVHSVNAASFSITSGISETTVGKTYTISISAKGLTGKFNISHSSNVSVNVSSVWIDNGTADSKIVVTAKSEGKATVTVTPSDVSDASTGEPVSLSSKTDTVTVKSNSSSGGGSSSGSNSGSGSSRSSSSGNSGNSQTTQAPSFTTVNETVYVTEDGINVRSSYSTSSKSVGSVNKGDKLTRIGVATTSINGIKWSKVKYNNQTAYITSAYLTTEKPEESNNKNLKSLTISGDYELTPAFDKDVTEYSMTIGTDVDSLDIKAVAEDSSAKVEVSGNDKLLTGENTIEVKVTAEDGTVRTYKINVKKGENANIVPSFGLSELSIDGYTLSPEFNKGIYEYKLVIEDSSITSLNVNAKSDEENAVIDISGNDELKLGGNIITILVKSEDGEDVVTYQIVVNITEKKEENNQLIAGIDNNDLYMYIGIGVAVLVVIIIVVVIAKRRNRDEDDFETYYGGFNSLDKDVDNNNFNNLIEKKENVVDENNNLGNNANIETIKEDLNVPEEKKDKKSVIEENFGEGIDYRSFTDDDTPRRRKGKHSK